MIAAASGLDGESSRPIADYGLLADCHTAALVSSDGSIDWLCLPRYDAPSVFARLLDQDAGHWSMRPASPFTATRRYLPGTLVVETTFTTAGGAARLTDAMAFAPGQRGHDLGIAAPHELLRFVEGIEGTVEIVMELSPRPEYGLVRPLFRRTAHGGRTFGGPTPLAVSAGVEVIVEGSTMRAAFVVEEDAGMGFALRHAAIDDAAPRATPPADVQARIRDAAAGWRSWESIHDIYDGPNRDLIRHSARVLKGLSYRPTGAIVAAPTTSLPETVGGGRNWDYRFAWIRDSSLTLEALYTGACPEEVSDFVSFMTAAAGGGRARRARCRSCTASAASTTCRSASSRTCTAGVAPGLSGSATAPGTRRSSTSTASSSTRSTSTARSSVSFIPRSSGSQPDSPMPLRPAGRAPTRGCGRCGCAAPPPVEQGALLGRAGPRREARAAAGVVRESRGLGRGA